MTRNQSLKSLAGKLGVGICSVVCVLGMMELVLPYVVTLEKVSLVYDPIVGFRGRANLEMVHTREMKGLSRVVRTNAFGFHDGAAAIQKKEGRHRLVFVGDSFVEAYQVDIADNFCRLTEKMLNEAHFAREHIETLNQGVHGYGLGSYALYVKNYLMAWQPDGVVLTLFLGNDLHDNYMPLASAAVPRFYLESGQLQKVPAPGYSWKMWLRDHVLANSTVVRFVWRRVFANNMKLMQVARLGGLVSTPQMVEESQQQLDEMTTVGKLLLKEIQAYLKSHQVALFVLVIPDPMTVNMAAFPEKFANDKISQRLVKNKDFLMHETVAALDALGVPYVLPFDRFVKEMQNGNEIYLNGYGHFSKTGHAVSAQALVPQLVDWITQK